MKEELLVTVNVLLGHVEPEMRYVRTGPGSAECQSRKKVFDRNGCLKETAEWAPLSHVNNVPESMWPMFRPLIDGRKEQP